MRSLRLPERLAALAAQVGAVVPGAAEDLRIHRLAPLASAQPGEIGFLSDARYAADARLTRASAVLVAEANSGLLPESVVALVVADPYVAFARLAQWFERRLASESVDDDEAGSGVHPSARVAASAVLDDGVVVGANAVIEAGARLAAGARIGAGAYVGRHACIGAGTVLFPNVTVYHDSMIGAQCRIHAGTVIGADGFGFAREGEGWLRIPQLGRAVIGDRVEIGALCAVDRGALEDTVIEDDCILDNLVQVAHNVHIGAGTAMAGCSGVAGSAKIGRRCLIGGGSGILGHITLCDDVIVGAMTFVSRSIAQPGFYSGTFPLMPNAGWERAAATVRQLPDLRSRLRKLEQLSRETR